MTDSRPVMKQYNKLLGILERFTQHKMNMDEAIQVSCIIDKLSHSWKDFKNTLKHDKDELTLVELGSHLRIDKRIMTSQKATMLFVLQLFSSVPRPSHKSLINGTEDIGGLVVLKEVTKEVVVQQPEPELKKSKRYHRSADCYGINSQFNYSSDGCEESILKWFSMKDIGEADVILGIRIKHKSNGIAISLSYYIEKVLKKSNYLDCTLVSTPMGTNEKMMPNNGQAVSNLSILRYTSNPSTQHWQAIKRASKKQTCITSSTMESEFVALAAIGKEAEWLRNLILEILLWLISIWEALRRKAHDLGSIQEETRQKHKFSSWRLPS
ncbi:zinc finger, CCHC-type containing protein [Tanacetum coccineum]